MDKTAKRIYDAVFKNVHLTKSSEVCEHLGITGKEFFDAQNCNAIIRDIMKRNRLRLGAEFNSILASMPLTSGSFDNGSR